MKSDHRRIRLESSGKNKVIGWGMTLEETMKFFKGQRKTVVTLLGYSGDYEDKKAMLKIVENVLAENSPETSIINIGATYGGIGAAYAIAKSMGFITTGIVSSQAIQHLDDISVDVDHICFVADNQWGGKLPNSNDLSPTSQAMVECSDILVGIGGGPITRDEMIAGKEQGKLVQFYPAEINHEIWIRHTQEMNLPSPASFWGDAHEVFGSTHDS